MKIASWLYAAVAKTRQAGAVGLTLQVAPQSEICGGMIVQSCVLVLAAFLAGSAGAQENQRRPVIVLRPVATFSDYETDAELPPDQLEAESYCTVLDTAIQQELEKRGMPVASRTTAAGPEVEASLRTLHGHVSKMARGLIGDDGRQALTAALAATNSEDVLVFAQYMRARVGDHGRWKAGYGILTPQMATITIQAALISARTGQVLWQGQVFLRDLPKPQTPKFNTLVSQLYKDFKPTAR
jgi:hypothetical protein